MLVSGKVHWPRGGLRGSVTDDDINRVPVTQSPRECPRRSGRAPTPPSFADVVEQRSLSLGERLHVLLDRPGDVER